MSLQTLGMIAVALVCAGILWYAGKYFYTAYRLSKGNMMFEQLRLPNEAAPDTLAGIDQAIERLGFEYKLTMQRRLVMVPRPERLRVYVHPTLNIELGLTEQQTEPPFNLSFETIFADGAMLATTYPTGYSITTEKIGVRYAAYSLQEAFDHHFLSQLSWAESHGDAMPIPAGDDAYFARNTETVKQNGAILYAPIIRAQVGSGIVMIGFMFIVIGIASQALSGAAVFSFNFLTFTTLSFLIGLALAVGGNGWANRGKPLPAVDADKAPVADPNVHPLNRPVRTI